MRALGLWITAAALVVAGSSYYGLVIWPQQRFQAGLDQWVEKLPPGYAAHYENAHYSIWSGHATLSGFALHGVLPGAAPQDFDIAIDDIELSKPALDFSASWSQAEANPAALTPDTALAIGDSIALRGVTLHAGTMSMSLDATQLDRPRIYPWALFQPGVPTWSEVQDVFLRQMRRAMPPPQFTEIQSLLRFEAARMLCLGYDRYTAENLKATAQMPATPTTPAMAVSYSIRKMDGAVDRGFVKEATVEGLALQIGPMGSFTVDRMSMADWDMRKPLNQAVSAQALNPAMLDGLKLGHLEYGGMTVQMAGGTPIALGTFALSNFVFVQSVPISGALSWNGFHMTRAQVPNTPQAIESWNKLGLDAITVSFGLAYKWDLDGKRMTLDDTELKIDELGALKLSIELSDIVPGIATLTQGRLVHAALRYDDASLTERALRMGAAQSGADPVALRQQWIAVLQQQGTAPGVPPALAAAATAFAAFLGAPHSLAIELAPSQPVPLVTLMAARSQPPASFLSSLGIAVSANQ